jgi:hypothetical protein
MKMNWKEIFRYNEDGTLTRLFSNNQHNKVGWVNSQGYCQVEVFNKNFMLHRIIYEMHNGTIPTGFQIDHIDGNPLNNKIENLRICTQIENRQNSKLSKNNTTGYRGIVKTPNGKYQARLTVDGKKLYLGLFNTPEEAFNCVEQKRKELYGEFAILRS